MYCALRRLRMAQLLADRRKCRETHILLGDLERVQRLSGAAKIDPLLRMHNRPNQRAAPANTAGPAAR
jgi:hypothetical protein